MGQRDPATPATAGDASVPAAGKDNSDDAIQLPHPPVLRPMTPGDLDALMVVQREGAQAGLGDIFPQERFPFPTDVIRRQWQQELADPAIDCFVVLDDHHAVAGFVVLKADEFLHFGTAVSSWGTGLAALAHDEAVAHWTARGYPHAHLRVFEDNRRARRFYERRGWRPTGERTRSAFAPYPTLLTYGLELTPERPRPSG